MLEMSKCIWEADIAWGYPYIHSDSRPARTAYETLSEEEKKKGGLSKKRQGKEVATEGQMNREVRVWQLPVM